MAEKYTYGPLIYNCMGEEDDSGNYWWSGSPPVGYEAESGPYRIPIDINGNQCLPGECILHPNCRVEDWETDKPLPDVPSLAWCRIWFDENFLVIDDYQLCKYIIRWYWWNHGSTQEWRNFSVKNIGRNRYIKKTIDEIIGEIWPDVLKS